MRKIYYTPLIKVKKIASSSALMLTASTTNLASDPENFTHGGSTGTVDAQGGGVDDGSNAPDAKRFNLWGSPDVEE